MDNDLEFERVKKCLEAIELKLNWGPGGEWRGQDFERLSLEIQKVTGVILSVTTLKRLWGKLKYTNVPTTTTLNALAQFAGYENWLAFKKELTLEEIPVLTPQFVSTNQNRKIGFGKLKYWCFGMTSFIIVAGLLLFSNAKIEKPIDRSAYTFSSNKVNTEGVPNSVIFNFNATAANQDTVFIAQSWDVSRKVSVSPLAHTYSAIYYHPGYFRAKLIVGRQIVKEHDLMISSGGWVAMVENNGGVPLYFKAKELLSADQVEVNEKLLSQYNISLQPTLPKLRFYNVQELGGIKNDHFIFETTLKSEFKEGTAACQRVDVLILCKNEVISIPLSSRGCVGDLSLYVAGTELKSADADLSNFGCDLGQWVKLRVEAKNGNMQFLINDKQAYSIPFSSTPADIVGIQYRFNGTGAVKDTRFIKDNRVIDF